jgi:prephenate dehydrogenase
VNDTLELFRDMQNYNPYAKEMRKQFYKALTEIEVEVELELASA